MVRGICKGFSKRGGDTCKREKCGGDQAGEGAISLFEINKKGQKGGPPGGCGGGRGLGGGGKGSMHPLFINEKGAHKKAERPPKTAS